MRHALTRRLALALLFLPALSGALHCADEADQPLDAPVSVPAAPVRLVTDTSGVTHVYARSDADAFYGAGYAMARDRLFQMEVNRRRAQGRMAELFGQKRKKDDIGARSFHFSRLGEQDYERLRRERPGDADLLDAWARGINARIDEIRSGAAPRPYGLGPGEYDFVPEPWRPSDGAAIGKLLAFGLSTSFESELLATAVYKLAPDFAARVPILQPAYDEYVMAPGKTADPATVSPPKIPQGAPQPGGPGPSFSSFSGLFGQHATSNNWAITGARSANGKPLLAGDPHQALTSPARLWPIHISSAEGGGSLDVAGFAFAGTPGVQLGHNARVGWTATTNFADAMDMWDVTRTDDDSAILLGDKTVPLVRRTETIRVRREGGRVGENDEETIVVEEAPGYGVLLPGDILPVPPALLIGGDAILFQWTGFAPTVEFSAYLAMDRARDVGEYEAAVNLIEVGAQNFVAADAAHVLHHVHARIPDRGKPSDHPMPWRILPGSDGRTLWTDKNLRPDQFPHIADPPTGYVATGNTDPWGFTADGNVENDPFYYGAFFATGFRPYRIRNAIEERFAAKGKLDRGDMEEIQRDVVSPMAETLVPRLASAVEQIGKIPELDAYKTRDDLKALAGKLAAWDRRFSLDSGEALLFLGLEWFAAKRLFSGDASLLFGPIAEESPPFFLGMLRNTIERRYAGADALLPPGGQDALLLASLADSAAWLAEVFGSADPSAYSLGKLHAAEFPSAYGNKLDIGRFPIPGGPDTINVSPAPFFKDGKPLPAFACTEMALYRMAISFGDDNTPEATFDLAMGSSEDPSSPYFLNLQPDWASALHRPFLFRKAAVEAARAAEVTLPPAR